MCLGVPGKIEKITGEAPHDLYAKVSFGGILKEVSLAFLPDTSVGDYVIVHVGFAISKINEVEAQKVFGYLKEIGEINEISE